MESTHEQALKAIINAEKSKATYQSIKNLTIHKKDCNPLTQVDILDSTHTSTIMLTNKASIKHAVILHNQKHSWQSL